MKHVALILLLAASPALAQEAQPETAPQDDGFSLMEEGAKLLFRGLMTEVGPALDGMGQAVADLEPALKQLVAMIDDIRNYSAPELLENGDIIIRRKVPLPPAADPVPGPNGEIEL